MLGDNDDGEQYLAAGTMAAAHGSRFRRFVRRCLREGMDGGNPPKALREGPPEPGQEMARRSPAVTGSERAPSGREFRWDRGQLLFALSQTAQGVSL